MTPGETFKPVELRKSTKGKLYPPAIVDQQKHITSGEKQLYRRLYGRAQTDSAGICWPSFKSLSDDLGKSERQVKYDAKRLEIERRLIRHRRRGARQSNTYEFLWHDVFEVQPNAFHGRYEGKPSKLGSGQISDVQPIASREATPEVQSPAHGEVQDAAKAKCNGLHTNSFKECSQGTLSSSEPQQSAGGHDDDDSPEETKQEDKAVKDILLSFIKERGYKAPSGHIPDEVIERKLNEIGGGPKDLQEFLTNVYGKRLKEPPNTWRHVERSVLNYLSDPTVAGKISIPKTMAKRREESRIKAEHSRQAEEAKQRVLNEKMAPSAAIDKAREHRGRRVIPEILVKRLIRRDELVSPDEVIRQVKACRDCRDCGNEGTHGSALMGALHFCSCIRGEELREEFGDEILHDRVTAANVSLRARLIAACADLKLFYTGLEECSIVEGDTIEVTSARKSFVTNENLRDLMAYIGDPRKIVLRSKDEAAGPERPAEKSGLFDDCFYEELGACSDLGREAEE